MCTHYVIKEKGMKILSCMKSSMTQISPFDPVWLQNRWCVQCLDNIQSKGWSHGKGNQRKRETTMRTTMAFQILKFCRPYINITWFTSIIIMGISAKRIKPDLRKCEQGIALDICVHVKNNNCQSWQAQCFHVNQLLYPTTNAKWIANQDRQLVNQRVRVEKWHFLRQFSLFSPSLSNYNKPFQ